MAVSDQMKPALYRAAMGGKYEDYYEALAADNGVGCRQVTASGNTVLHVAALHGQKQFVENILEKDNEDHVASSMLLTTRNKKDESVVHSAAEKGHADIVSVLISAAKKYHQDVEHGVGVAKTMIGMRDNVKDTALHKAVRMGHLEVVKLLVKEDPQFEYLPNDDGETPIYIAAEMQFHECLVEMLNKCENPTYGGPMGRNPLHAAILSGICYTNVFNLGRVSKEFSAESAECMNSLLEKKVCLCEETDDFGWTPLHYAVRIRNNKAACMIVERKTFAAYICSGSEKEWTTTFHIAARWKNIEMMKEISNRCPDCWEMVNSKGQNVLHEAILNEKMDVIRHIESSDQFDNLVNQKDENGNTPLHLLAVYKWGWKLFIPRFIRERPMLNYLACNKKHQTLFDMAVLELEEARPLAHGKKAVHRTFKDINPERKVIDKHVARREKEIEGMIEKGKTSIVVATLITTMTFAAGIAVPGGYDQEKGNPILLKNAAFKAFIITNTFSFLSSICSIALHIAMVRKAQVHTSPFEKYWTVRKLYYWQENLLRLTYLGVVIAFMCAMYATLAPLLPLAIAVLILGLSIPLLTLIRYGKAVFR